LSKCKKLKRRINDMIKTEQRLFTTLDLYLSSFLSLNGIPPNLEFKNGRVIFVFPISNNLNSLSLEFNSNVSVPVADFVVTIKTLRGQMLTMREVRK